MPKPLIIVVGGYIIGYPLGGMTWHHLNYLLGLHALGHEVWFLEDSGEYSLPYNPETRTCGADSTFGQAYLQRTFAEYGLPTRYCYYSQFEDRHYGLNSSELNELLARADLMICVSGVTPMRESRPRPKRTLVVDTDPVFTQIRMSNDAQFQKYYRSFDRVATFGRLIGTPGCALPTHGFDWIPTNQPVSLIHWPAMPLPSTAARAFTTIGKWEHATARSVEFQGHRLVSSKSVEWMRMIGLPGRAKLQMTLAMEAMPADVRSRFESHGWNCTDAHSATRSCVDYQRFIRASAAEFTVAKQIYARIKSGWFSDRSACYLASGRPVVTQSTGFEDWLPTGDGLLAFDDAEGAVRVLLQIAGDFERHAQAARAIAEKHFDSGRVLRELLDRALE